MRRLFQGGGVVGIVLPLCVLALIVCACAFAFSARSAVQAETQQANRRFIGVVGDSDSHSYQDRISFKPGSADRGGPYRAISFQWTDLLIRLRPDQLDMGPWGEWGTRGAIARLLDSVGLPSRAPPKEDYRYNFAVSGAECSDLLTGPARQVQRLTAVMDENPEGWKAGAVVIRIGTNSFGRAAHLDKLAADAEDAAVQATISSCLTGIRDTVERIRARHPQTAIVLVGIFDNVHWAKYTDRWQSAAAVDNISRGLDAFDRGLRRIVAEHRRMAFFDDRAWFRSRWGGRAANGTPAYGTVAVAQHINVAHSAGNPPSNSVLADGHAGTYWNALWARSLVDLLNENFGFGLRPISADEIATLIEPAAAAMGQAGPDSIAPNAIPSAGSAR